MKISMIFFLLCSINLMAENPCGIMYPNAAQNGLAELLLAPEKEGCLAIYHHDDDEVLVGVIESKQIIKSTDNLKFEVRLGQRNCSGYDFEMGFDPLLKVYETCGDYYRVLQNTNGYGYFIKIEDVKQITRSTNYLEVLKDWSKWADNRAWNIGINEENHCLRLREGPETTFNILDCIKNNSALGNGHHSIRVLDWRSSWALVEVSHWIYTDESREDEVYCGTFVKKEKGWLKAVGDNGFPNIWFALPSY